MRNHRLREAGVQVAGDLELALELVPGRRRLDQGHGIVLVTEIQIAVGVDDARRSLARAP